MQNITMSFCVRNKYFLASYIKILWCGTTGKIFILLLLWKLPLHLTLKTSVWGSSVCLVDLYVPVLHVALCILLLLLWNAAIISQALPLVGKDLQTRFEEYQANTFSIISNTALWVLEGKVSAGIHFVWTYCQQFLVHGSQDEQQQGTVNFWLPGRNFIWSEDWLCHRCRDMSWLPFSLLTPMQCFRRVPTLFPQPAAIQREFCIIWGEPCKT